MPRKAKKGSNTQVDTASHYVVVLLEEIRDQVKLVAESAEMTRDRLESRIEESRVELKGEIADVRTGLSARIDSVRAELKGEIVSVRTELAETRSELSDKLDKIGVRLDKHDMEIKDSRQARNAASSARS